MGGSNIFDSRKDIFFAVLNLQIRLAFEHISDIDWVLHTENLFLTFTMKQSLDKISL